MLIAIQDLSFQYSGSEHMALDGLNMTVEQGDFIGIIGGSGAGKSTLAYALSGVIPHHLKGDFYGSVTVDGMDTVDTKLETLAQSVAVVMQDIEGQMVASAVEDEIMFGLENFRVPREEIEERIASSLEMVGISELRGRMIDTLSGGQKQKVALAAILALRPQILILDEPTGELDPQSSRQIFTLLKELNEKTGMTVLVIEQKIMLLCEFVKKLAVLNQGKLVAYGDVREILKDARQLKEFGVNCPRVTDLCQNLSEAGRYGGPTPVSVEEAVQMVKEVLAHG